MTTGQRQTLRADSMATPVTAAKRLGQIFDKLNQRIDNASRRSIVEFTYVAASPVFPILLDGPGFPVRGLTVMRVFDTAAVGTPIGAGVIDWTPTAEGVSIINMSGVTAGSTFRITLEMVG